jgi:hypothetical protein
MKVTASSLIRWSGLAALVAGLIFAGIQPIHPPDVLSSVTTGAWAIITTLKTVMCLLFLIGIAGIYARQVEEAGWLGLAGFLLLILCWWLQSAYVFAETFILPQLATAAPPFVVSFLGIASGIPGEMNIGPLPAIYSFGIGIPYMLGGLLFGIATLRAGILPPGRSACRRRYVDPRSGAAPARHPAASGDPGRVGSGLAGICALVRTASANLGPRTWRGKPPAAPNCSRVRSLGSAWVCRCHGLLNPSGGLAATFLGAALSDRGREDSVLFLALIHRSAWKGNSSKST